MKVPITQRQYFPSFWPPPSLWKISECISLVQFLVLLFYVSEHFWNHIYSSDDVAIPVSWKCNSTNLFPALQSYDSSFFINTESHTHL